MFTDMLFPALLLGWWNARVSRESSLRWAIALTLPLAIATVALLPLYQKLVEVVEPVWWWPKGPVAIGIFLATNAFFATIAVLLPLPAFHKDSPL